MIQILLCPGYVISKFDGERHWIDASTLEKLYRINRGRNQVAILCEDGTVNGHWSQEEYSDWLRLYPLHDGNYEDKIKELNLEVEMKLKTVADIEKEYQEKYTYEDSIPSPDTLREAAKELIKKENLLKLKKQFGSSTGPWVSMIHEHSDPKDWTVIEFAAFVIKHFFNLEDK